MKGMARMSSNARETVFTKIDNGYTLTVKKLIEELEKLPKSYRVYVSGYAGGVGGVELISIERDDKFILLHSKREDK